MAGALEYYASGFAARTEAKRVSSELARLNTSTALSRARSEASAEVQASKVDATVFVARRAMEAAALLSGAEQAIASAIPGSSGRVGFIADQAVLALGGIVSDTAFELRRVAR